MKPNWNTINRYASGVVPETKPQAVAEHNQAMAEYLARNGAVQEIPAGTMARREGPLTHNQKKMMGMIKRGER